MRAKEVDFGNTRRPFDLNEMALAVKLHKKLWVHQNMFDVYPENAYAFKALIYISSAVLNGRIWKGKKIGSQASYFSGLFKNYCIKLIKAGKRLDGIWHPGYRWCNSTRSSRQ
jgi:hypothetical protein